MARDASPEKDNLRAVEDEAKPAHFKYAPAFL